jgi:hypothetical protein
MPTSEIIPASTGTRSPGSRAINRNPANTPGCSSVAPRPNGRRMLATSSAEATNVAASIKNSVEEEAPAPSTTPPSSGPRR